MSLTAFFSSNSWIVFLGLNFLVPSTVLLETSMFLWETSSSSMGIVGRGLIRKAFEPISTFTSFTYWGLQYIFIWRSYFVYKCKIFWGQRRYTWDWVHANESLEKDRFLLIIDQSFNMIFVTPMISNHVKMWLAPPSLLLDSYLNIICCITQFSVQETREGIHVSRKGILINTFYEKRNFLRRGILMYLAIE